MMAIAAAAVFPLAMAACSDATSQPKGSSTPGPAPSQGLCPRSTVPVTLVKPPPPPDAGTTGGGSVLLAVTTFFLGDTDRSGAPSDQAWQSFGYDLDGLSCPGISTGHCALRPGAIAVDVLRDGDGGVDNSFGKSCYPILAGLVPTFSADANRAVSAGVATLMIRVDGLPAGDGRLTGASLAVVGEIDSSGKPRPPTTDESANGTYPWHARAEFLQGAEPAPAVAFSDGWRAGDFVVLTGADVVALELHGSGTLRLRIQRPTITMRLSADRRSAEQGIISGVLRVEDAAAAARVLGVMVAPQLCQSTALEGVVDQVEQCADVLTDLAQDPSRTCDGISIGIGFRASSATLSTPSAAPFEPPSPCPAGP
jgi:hypothetical protein